MDTFTDSTNSEGGAVLGGLPRAHASLGRDRVRDAGRRVGGSGPGNAAAVTGDAGGQGFGGVTSDGWVEHVHPGDVHAELGAWTHAVSLDLRRRSRLVFISGQTPIDQGGRVVAPDDLEVQVRQVYTNLRRIVEACGGTLDNILSLRTFLTRQEDVTPFRDLRDKLHQELFPRGNYPAHTLVLTTGLALPTIRVEVEAVVAV